MTRVGLSLAAALVATFTGCGGGGGPTTPSGLEFDDAFAFFLGGDQIALNTPFTQARATIMGQRGTPDHDEEGSASWHNVSPNEPFISATVGSGSPTDPLREFNISWGCDWDQEECEELDLADAQAIFNAAVETLIGIWGAPDLHYVDRAEWEDIETGDIDTLDIVVWGATDGSNVYVTFNRGFD